MVIFNVENNVENIKINPRQKIMSLQVNVIIENSLIDKEERDPNNFKVL